MDSEQLHRRISDLTSALGDPTRRAIYIAVRESQHPMTTTIIAELFGIHPNVARHHLEKLATEGYLKYEEIPAGKRAETGAGRPAKQYTASAKTINLNFPETQSDLLVGLLVKLIDHIAPEDVAEIAEGIGRDYGENLATEIGSPDEQGYEAAVIAVTQAMGGLGFGMDADLSQQRMLTSSCPFGEVANSYPEIICSLDRGIVTGLFSQLNPACTPVLHPHVKTDLCVTEVSVSIEGNVLENPPRKNLKRTAATAGASPR